jgi:hypothetical protein
MAWNEFGPILDDRAVLELKLAQSIGTVDPNELGTKLVSDYCQGRYGLPDDLRRLWGSNRDRFIEVVSYIESFREQAERFRDSVGWLLADLFVFVFNQLRQELDPSLSDWDVIEAMLDVFGSVPGVRSPFTLYRYMQVATRFPPEVRSPEISFSFYFEANELDRQIKRLMEFKGAQKSLTDTGTSSDESDPFESIPDAKPSPDPDPVLRAIAASGGSRSEMVTNVVREVLGVYDALTVTDPRSSRIVLFMEPYRLIADVFDGETTLNLVRFIKTITEKFEQIVLVDPIGNTYRFRIDRSRGNIVHLVLEADDSDDSELTD